MKVSFNAKINSIFAIGGMFLAIRMIYSKGRSDLIEELYAIKKESEDAKKSTMPRASKKATIGK